jgi:tellurite resistance protein
MKRRIPPNLFAVGFGLAGLGGTWQAATRALGMPRAVANAIDIVAAVVWAVVTVAYLRQGRRTVLAVRSLILLARGQFLATREPTGTSP